MEIKTELRYSCIYSVILNNDFINKAYSLKQHEKLIKDCKPFKRLYNENISKITRLIEKYTKRKKWQYGFIPIYIVKKNRKNNSFKIKSKNKRYNGLEWKGFGDPLTIVLMKPKIMLYTLIHELVHMNLDEKMQFRLREEKIEELVILISQKVWKDLNLGDWKK